MLRAFFQRRREFRARGGREATALLMSFGNGAHAEARRRMRAALDSRDLSEAWLWSKVTLEIDRHIGGLIDTRGGTRWPIDVSQFVLREAPSRPSRAEVTKRWEIADRLAEISRGIADISAGRSNATTIHNIGVDARQIVDLAEGTPDLEQAVGELIAACEGVVIALKMEELEQGQYPSASEAASRALQRLKALALDSRSIGDFDA